MGFLDYQILDSDFTGKGISPLPQYPQLRSPQMQQKFDELVKLVVTPRFNALVQRLSELCAGDVAVSVSGLPATDLAGALEELQSTLDGAVLAAGQLPIGGGAGQILKKRSDSSFDAGWETLSAETVGIADVGQQFAGRTVEAALSELAVRAALAMPMAGGTFSGAAVDGSENAATKLRNITVRTKEGEEGADVSTGSIVMVRV